jgi:hypothetical protein
VQGQVLDLMPNEFLRSAQVRRISWLSVGSAGTGNGIGVASSSSFPGRPTYFQLE